MGRKNRHNALPIGGRGRPGGVTPHDRPDAYSDLLALARKAEQAGQVAEAQVFYRQIVEQDARHFAANRNLATLYTGEYHHRDALAHWRVVVAADENHLHARMSLAHCLHQLKRGEESVEQYRRAIEIAQTRGEQVPNAERAGAWSRLAAVYQDLDRYAEAEECLRSAIGLQPGNAQACAALGYLYGTLGRAADAREKYREAIRLQPDLVSAHRYLALARQHSEIDDEVRMMLALYESGRMTDENNVLLAFTLGKVYEDLGQHEQAFAYWLEGNRRQRDLHPHYTVDRDIAPVQKLRKVFRAHYMCREASQASSSVTPVFIVSMPRAGSSLAEQILASHPDVYGGGELTTLHELCMEAVERFPGDLARLMRDDWQTLGANYLEIVSRPMRGERVITNKLPGNFQLIGAIRMMFPEARVIHCCREPLDTALSCFKNIFGAGTVLYSYDLNELGKLYRLYEKMMAYWNKVLPGWIYALHYEQLTTAPEAEIRQLLEFVGLPFDERCLSFYETERVTKTASAVQVREPIHRDSVNLGRHYRQQLRPFEKARKGGLFGF